MGLTTTAGELAGLVPLNAMLDAGRYYHGMMLREVLVRLQLVLN